MNLSLSFLNTFLYGVFISFNSLLHAPKRYSFASRCLVQFRKNIVLLTLLKTIINTTPQTKPIPKEDKSNNENKKSMPFIDNLFSLDYSTKV